MRVYLMHKDVHVAELEVSGSSMVILEILNADHMPIGVKDVPAEWRQSRLEKWLKDRCIPSEQPNYTLLLQKAGVSSITSMPIKSYMCSLTDCYWFKPIKDMVTWKDVNFFDNGFSDAAGKITLYGDDTIEIENWNVPELTTSGVLPKRWFQGKNGGFYLMKAGTPPGHVEVRNEAFASQCATLFGLDAVPYAIFHDESGNDYSVCPSFIHNDHEEFVTLEQIRISMGLSHEDALQYLYDIGFGNEVDALRGFDYLIKNSDRHFGNLGIIRDPDTLEILRLAPLFDHGFSMDASPVQEVFMQKLTDKMGQDELNSIKNLEWVLHKDIRPIDIMKRARETYSDVYVTSLLMNLTNDIGRRLFDLQDAAENREKVERNLTQVQRE